MRNKNGEFNKNEIGAPWRRRMVERSQSISQSMPRTQICKKRFLINGVELTYRKKLVCLMHSSPGAGFKN